MKRFTLISVLSFALVACGTQEPGTPDVVIDDTCTSDCDGDGNDTALSAAPFRSPAPYVFDLNSRYTKGEPTAEVLGDMPGMNWTTGIAVRDSDSDGWLGMDYQVPAGTYTFTWRAGSPVAPADYGQKENLVQMTSDELAFVSCNWWDTEALAVVTVDAPSCNVRVDVDDDGNITPAGNMSDLNPDLL